MDRRLAAIMATDVVGYSRLMGADEAGTLKALRALRSELLDPLIASSGGRIVKLVGDGTLVEFGSVVDAVTCAVAIQRELAERNAARAQEARLELRIGINLGDLVVDGDDLYGDGVNVAARLEAAAEPGSVYVSRTVVDHADGKVALSFANLGERNFKNIERAVQVYRVDATGASAPEPRRRSLRRRLVPPGIAAIALSTVVVGAWNAGLVPMPASSSDFDESAVLAVPSGPTLAVLPFQSLTAEAEQDLIAQGLSEDIIVELGRYRDLNILSGHATEAHEGSSIDVQEIGRKIGADYLLQGTVRMAGERIRVTARLSSTATGAQVWAEAFDEALTAGDLFDVQLRITERVASAVGDSDGAIKRIDMRRARTKPPENLSSYECALYRADFFYRKEEQKRVSRCIERVVAEEPDYWRGWAQLAHALAIDVKRFSKLYAGTHAEKLDRALDAARKAVSLNPEAPRAYFVLAEVLLLKKDLEGFNAAAEDALALGGDRSVEAMIGCHFVWSGRHELGAALLRRSIELNPAFAPERWHRCLARYHFVKGEFEAALSAFQSGDQPDKWWIVALEVAILTELGRTAEATDARGRLYSLRPGVEIADLVWVYRRFRRPDADIAKYVAAFRKAGLPEGKYTPLDPSSDG